MKYDVQKGDVLDLLAPYDVNVANADLGYQPCFKVGSIIAAAVTNAASGAAIEGQTVGVITGPKATGETWAVGDLLYWDDSAKKFTKTSTSNTKAGFAMSVTLTGDTSGALKLVPSI
jgi:predicted RecA/RadA family phage recombinase